MSSQITPAEQGQYDERVADVLQEVLLQTFDLAVITLNYHWNVEGRHFYDMHKLLEEQYDELWSSLDPLAERVRALGFQAVLHYGDRGNSPSSSSSIITTPSADMASKLVSLHADMASLLKHAIELAKESDDEASISMLGERLVAHDKWRWMLRSMARDQQEMT